MKMRSLFLIPLLALFLLNCSEPEAIDDFKDFSVTLIDQDSSEVVFPDEYEGDFLVMGFVYTNCPDICPLITGNLKKIQQEMGDPDDVTFIGLSFDPQRDTPAVLHRYHEAFGLNSNFRMLTGDTTQVQQFLQRVKVRTQVSMSQTTPDGREIYFLNHSDKIIVLDDKGRWVYEYGGSMTSPDIIIEDLNKIR
jgi:protein SCO1/2